MNRRVCFHTIIALGVLAFATAASEVPARPSGGAGGTAGTFPNEEMAVGEQKRLYRLIVPETIDSKKAAPLVFAFHGLLDSKDLMPIYSQLDKLAAEKNFILVYPNGLNRHWPLIPQLATRDVHFFDALLEHLSKNYNIDLNRVYLTGMSNGAYFSNLLASMRSEKIAAIAPHSGGLGALALGPINVKHKYAVFLVHGSADAIVKVDESRKALAAYRAAGHAVEFLEVPRLNHLWAHEVDVNHKLWSFFEAHPMQK
ncbi:MAG TPA: PHB depolymerase family esterase [Planctomycetota bacterium]|nr:PHB depolymerase family esterase [Planctomycetota bacterium]